MEWGNMDHRVRSLQLKSHVSGASSCIHQTRELQGRQRRVLIHPLKTKKGYLFTSCQRSDYIVSDVQDTQNASGTLLLFDSWLQDSASTYL